MPLERQEAAWANSENTGAVLEDRRVTAARLPLARVSEHSDLEISGSSRENESMQQMTHKGPFSFVILDGNPQSNPQVHGALGPRVRKIPKSVCCSRNRIRVLKQFPCICGDLLHDTGSNTN